MYCTEHAVIKNALIVWGFLANDSIKGQHYFFIHYMGWRGNINFLYNCYDASLGLGSKSYTTTCISPLLSRLVLLLCDYSSRGEGIMLSLSFMWHFKILFLWQDFIFFFSSQLWMANDVKGRNTLRVLFVSYYKYLTISRSCSNGLLSCLMYCQCQPNSQITSLQLRLEITSFLEHWIRAKKYLKFHCEYSACKTVLAPCNLVRLPGSFFDLNV